jgi:hypothetical protein
MFVHLVTMVKFDICGRVRGSLVTTVGQRPPPPFTRPPVFDRASLRLTGSGVAIGDKVIFPDRQRSGKYRIKTEQKPTRFHKIPGAIDK